ncbi:FAD-binding protein [Streptomyces sp. NPDC101225]|uniref:FAD-binding protein n=1 Tax=Streptomyces sp. NPDC101225 TaxID=3366135 RepID=UPI0038289E99
MVVEAADPDLALQRDSSPPRHQRLSPFSAFDGHLKSPAGTLVGLQYGPVAPVRPGYGSLGGVAVSDRFQAVDEDGDAVAGLFGAGRDVNSVYGGTYPFVRAGDGASFSHNSGRIAGANAASR